MKMQMSLFKISNVLLFACFAGWAFTPVEKSLQDADRCSDQTVTYTIQEGDNLYNISKRFGSYLFWESIYIANADRVQNPDLIFAGQEIQIPHNVAIYKEGDIALSQVLENPFCRIAELPYNNIEERFLARYSLEHLVNRAETEREEERKEREREEQMAGADNQPQDGQTREQNANRENEQRQTERQLMRELDGMVHDDTRSKVGRDFYDVFYSHWQSPPEARNFSIKVSEQPSPNLGTTILVEVNRTETFKMRLQPRYEMIQEAGKYAVQQTYAHLKNNDQGMIIY